MKPGNLTNLSLLLLCTIAVVYGALQSQLPHKTFWSNDGGEKLVQIRALIENGFTKPDLPYDSLELEPKGSFEFAPFYPGHAKIIDERLMPTVPLYFPLLSSIPFRFWGHAGLYAIPLIASLIILYSLILLTRYRFDHTVMPLTVICTGLASPVFFYSLLFFEHTLAACFATAGLTLIHTGFDKARSGQNIYAAAAGLLTGLGIWFRGDIYFFVLGILAAMMIVRKYRSTIIPFIMGCVVVLIPFYLINHQIYGSLIGPQVASMLNNSGEPGFSLISFAEKRWDILEYLIFSFIDMPIANWVFFVATVCPALLINLHKTTSPMRNMIVLAWCTILVLISCFTFGRLFFLEDAMSSTLGILGLFACIPFLPFSLVFIQEKKDGERNEIVRFLYVLIIISLLGYSLGLPSRGGLQWGPRYLLALYPALILLSVNGAVELRKSLSVGTAQRVFTMLFVLILLSGICIQLFGVMLLYDKKEATSLNISAIQKMNPEVLVTDTWWVPEDNADLYAEIPMYSVYTFDTMNTLFRLLAKKGKREILLVSAADYRNYIAKQPNLKLTSFVMTDHQRMHLFNLYLHKIQLGR